MTERENRTHARDRAAWRRWLAANHARRREVYLVFWRKGTGKACLSYDEAVEEALCFGWIDGIKHKLDDERYTYRFTPRRPGSAWSESNRRRIARLLEAGLVQPAGLAALEHARRSGALEKPARAPDPGKVPPELMRELRSSRAARAAYRALTLAQQRQWRRWVAEAKLPATRERRAAAAREALVDGRGDPWRKT